MANIIQPSTDFEGGVLSVGTTAVPITTLLTTRKLLISASLSNTGYIYIGKSNVLSNGTNAMIVLNVGNTITLDYNNTYNPIYVIASTTSQSINYIAFN